MLGEGNRSEALSAVETNGWVVGLKHIIVCTCYVKTRWVGPGRQHTRLDFIVWGGAL